MTAREMAAVGDFLATLSPWMVRQLAKPEARELAKNDLLVREIRAKEGVRNEDSGHE